jgi:putative heme-binding domain-containing protein
LGYADGWESFLPSTDPEVLRLIRELRVMSRDPGIVGELVGAIQRASRQVDAFDSANFLRTLDVGWDESNRKVFFAWIATAEARIRNGDWIGGDHALHFLELMKLNALSRAPKDQHVSLANLAATPPAVLPQPPERSFVMAWAPRDLLDGAGEVSSRRHFDVGKRVYHEAKCAACHMLGGSGGAVGPDLSGLAGKFGYQDLLRELLQPSLVIPDTFAQKEFRLKDGSSFVGRRLSEENGVLLIQTNPIDPATVRRLPAAEVSFETASKISPMPAGLLNRFTREEVLDLMAYLLSGGRQDDPAFE